MKWPPRPIRGRHRAEREIDSPQNDKFKYGTSTIEWLHEHVDSCAHRVEGRPKFKYLFPLDGEIVKCIKPLAQTYPQIRTTSEISDTPGVHPGEGRAAPTVAL